jgi:hypothetical protein
MLLSNRIVRGAGPTLTGSIGRRAGKPGSFTVMPRYIQQNIACVQRKRPWPRRLIATLTIEMRAAETAIVADIQENVSDIQEMRCGFRSVARPASPQERLEPSAVKSWASNNGLALAGLI